MITSKQRAFLRKQANGIEPIFQIGKSGITDEVISQLALALETRELIKVHILETALLETKEALDEVSKRLKAEPVQAIGSKFVIYKRANNEKNRKLELPKKCVKK